MEEQRGCCLTKLEKKVFLQVLPTNLENNFAWQCACINECLYFLSQLAKAAIEKSAPVEDDDLEVGHLSNNFHF